MKQRPKCCLCGAIPKECFCSFLVFDYKVVKFREGEDESYREFDDSMIVCYSCFLELQKRLHKNIGGVAEPGVFLVGDSK